MSKSFSKAVGRLVKKKKGAVETFEAFGTFVQFALSLKRFVEIFGLSSASSKCVKFPTIRSNTCTLKRFVQILELSSTSSKCVKSPTIRSNSR